jgi:hypothetical protein
VLLGQDLAFLPMLMKIFSEDLVQILPYAANAAFNAPQTENTQEENGPTCLPGTRVNVLERVREW